MATNDSFGLKDINIFHDLLQMLCKIKKPDGKQFTTAPLRKDKRYPQIQAVQEDVVRQYYRVLVDKGVTKFKWLLFGEGKHCRDYLE